MLYAVAPDDWTDEFDLGMNKLNPKLNMGQGLVVEVIGKGSTESSLTTKYKIY